MILFRAEHIAHLLERVGHTTQTDPKCQPGGNEYFENSGY